MHALLLVHKIRESESIWQIEAYSFPDMQKTQEVSQTDSVFSLLLIPAATGNDDPNMLARYVSESLPALYIVSMILQAAKKSEQVCYLTHSSS